MKEALGEASREFRGDIKATTIKGEPITFVTSDENLEY